MNKIFSTLILLVVSLSAVAQCDTDNGVIIDLQGSTRINSLLRGDGSCVLSTIVNGGLEMVGATLSVVNGDTVGQVLRWTGTDWVPRKIIFPSRDTSYNGITRLPNAHVLGGNLTQNTTVNGVGARTMSISDALRITLEADRASGVAYTVVTLGSTETEGYDIFHLNKANAQLQSYSRVNYVTGNTMRLQSSNSVGTTMGQYWDGASYVTDVSATNGVDGKIFRTTKDGFFMYDLERPTVFSECGVMMWDTLTGQLRYQSPSILLAGAGTNLSYSGSSSPVTTVSSSGADVTTTAGPGIGIAATSTNMTITNTGDTNGGDDITTSTSAGGDLSGTYPTPSVVRIQGRSVANTAPATGQALKWSGTAWAPAADETGIGAGALNNTVRHDGAGWTSSSFLTNTGSRVGVGTSSPNWLMDLRYPTNDAQFNISGYTAKLRVGGNVAGQNTLAAEFVLESENASIPEVVTEIVPSARSTALYRYFGASVSNTFTGTAGTVRSQSGQPFYQKAWSAGAMLEYGYIDKANGANFSEADFRWLYRYNRTGSFDNRIAGTGRNSLARHYLTQPNAAGLGGFVDFYTNSDATPDYFGAWGMTLRGGTGDGNKQFAVHVSDYDNAKVVITGHVPGRMGLGVLSPSKELDINGAIRASSLAGTGERTLSANANGDIVATDPVATGVTPGTYGDNGEHVQFQVGADGRVTFAVEHPFNSEAYAAGSHTWAGGDYRVYADASSGAVTIDLPTAALEEKRDYFLAAQNNSSNAVSITGSLWVDGIGSASSFTLGLYEQVTVRYRSNTATYYIDR